ncbi:MAG TPA: AraC family transcriptional regulator [Acidimicrobiales bacterium]|nr:AraC family transcriptional regulator [Acidimicrobiales bacterium]
MLVRLGFTDVAAGKPYHAALVVMGGSRESRVDSHTHLDFYELMVVVAGSGTHRAGTDVYALEQGDVVVVRPHDVHTILAPPNGNLHFVNIAIPAATWSSVLAVGGLPASLWDRERSPVHVRLGAGDVATAVAAALEAVGQYHARPDPLDVLRLLGTVLPALVHRPDDRGPIAPDWLVRACAAMEQPDEMRVGVPRFVDLAGVSHAHLDRSMRTHFGTTPTDFVNELRLQRAARLLVTTAVPVGTIATECGFSTISYFCRRFRERFGRSARDFRNETRRAAAPGV